MPHPRVLFIARELKISTRTVVDWSNFCREVCIEWCSTHSNDKIGGPGKIIEIDEAKEGRRKYQKGRVLEGQWIFGRIEKGFSKLFIVPVENRDASTLVPLIKKHILPGSTIMSDCWRSYRNLNKEGFQHFFCELQHTFCGPRL
ncbi:hypothetical protein NQ317_001210, partial [Molorchus minor]